MKGLETVEGGKITCECGNVILKKYGIFGKKIYDESGAFWEHTCTECGIEYRERAKKSVWLTQSNDGTPAQKED